MDFMSTVKGSMLEDFYPAGWDMAKIDACCEKGVAREDFWHEDFQPLACENIYEFDTKMGHEIALQIKLARERGEKLAMIIPVGPMGMYKWAVYFLKEWNVCCDHVYTFNMDEWADGEGNTLPSDNPAAFEYCMKEAFFNKLGDLTVPENQRNFATKENLPTYPEKIAKLKAEGAKLHPLTIEQNALTSFKSRTTLVPCRANTVGPGLILQADYIIGGADGALGRGMGWQGMSFLTTLHYDPNPWITSSYIPTMPGKLFFLKELAGPLVPDVN